MGICERFAKILKYWLVHAYCTPRLRATFASKPFGKDVQFRTNYSSWMHQLDSAKARLRRYLKRSLHNQNPEFSTRPNWEWSIEIKPKGYKNFTTKGLNKTIKRKPIKFRVVNENLGLLLQSLPLLSCTAVNNLPLAISCQSSMRRKFSIKLQIGHDGSQPF